MNASRLVARGINVFTGDHMMTADKLTPYELRIFEARILADQPITLEELADEFGVARVRIKQVEARVIEKIKHRMQRSTEADQTILALEKRVLRSRRWQRRLVQND